MASWPGREHKQSIFHEKDLSNFVEELWFIISLVLCGCRDKIKANRDLFDGWYFPLTQSLVQSFIGIDRNVYNYIIIIVFYKLNRVKSQINNSINFALLIKITQANEVWCLMTDELMTGYV